MGFISAFKGLSGDVYCQWELLQKDVKEVGFVKQGLRLWAPVPVILMILQNFW